MRKFYHKKDLPMEESPLTLQLQRRHTVVEGDKESVKVVPKLKPVSRSNSTSSIYRSPKTAKDLSSQKGYLESTLSANSSGSSSASTVVITECQLSSSWLYNNKKAQMCPNETISAGESSSQQASDNEEGKSPIVHRPKVKSISSQNNRSRKCSSCCCYAAIVILAGFAVMGIISTIGGIIYMEFFSGSNKTQTRGKSAMDRGEGLSYTKKIDRVLDVGENHTSQDLMPRDENLDSFSESKQELEILNHFKDSNNDNTDKKQSKGSGNILRVRKIKKDVVPTTEVDITTSIHTTHEQQPQEDSNKKQSFQEIDFPSPSAKNNSPYSKLFELYNDIRANINENFKTLEESLSLEVDKLDTKITDVKADNTDLSVNKISELANQNGTEIDKHLRLLDDSFDTNDSLESLKPDSEFNSEENISRSKDAEQSEIPKYFFRKPPEDPGIALSDSFGITKDSDVDNSEEQLSESGAHIPQFSNLDSNDNVNSKLDVNNQDTSINRREDSLNKSFKSDLDFDLSASHVPSGEISGPAIPKNFFRMPSKDSGIAFRNMFDINERTDDVNSEPASLPRFLPHIPELLDQNDARDNIVSNLDVDNQEPDLPFELNHPVSEAKIAVPGPLDMIRRFTMGREPDKKGDSEVEQHDRRFFLAQALERLRSLDVRNILPSSRERSDSKKNLEQKFIPKVQNEQEVVTERSNYLQKLRRRLYEK